MQDFGKHLFDGAPLGGVEVPSRRLGNTIVPINNIPVLTNGDNVQVYGVKKIE